MNTIKEIGIMFKENPKAIITTVCGLLVGACLGAMAFFNGWLG